MNKTFILEAPGVEDKWYSIGRIEANLMAQRSLKIGRVGAHIRKYGNTLHLSN
jgi:hypothetical protein